MGSHTFFPVGLRGYGGVLDAVATGRAPTDRPSDRGGVEGVAAAITVAFAGSKVI